MKRCPGALLLLVATGCEQELIIGRGDGGGGASSVSAGGFGGAGGAGGSGSPGGMGGAGADGGSGGTGGSPPLICEGPPGSLLHVRFDDAESTLVPTVGDATNAMFSTTPVNDFVPAQSGLGLRLDAPEERAVYAEATEGAPGGPNISFAQGSLDFCFLPGPAKDNPAPVFLFDSRGLSLRRTGELEPDLRVTLRGLEEVELAEAIVSAADAGFSEGEWKRVTVTWNRGAAEREPSVRIFFDGVEASYAAQPLGPITNLPPSFSGRLRVGAGAEPTTSSNGVFDELRINELLILP